MKKNISKFMEIGALSFLAYGFVGVAVFADPAKSERLLLPKINRVDQARDLSLIVSYDERYRKEVRFQKVMQHIYNKYSKDPVQRKLYMKAADLLIQAISVPLDRVEEHKNIDRGAVFLFTCYQYVATKDGRKSEDEIRSDKRELKDMIFSTKRDRELYGKHKEISFSALDLSENRLRAEKVLCNRIVGEILTQEGGQDRVGE